MENPDTRQETPGTRRVGSRIVYYLDCSITAYRVVGECWRIRSGSWIFNYNIFMETKNPETAMESSWILHK